MKYLYCEYYSNDPIGTKRFLAHVNMCNIFKENSMSKGSNSPRKDVKKPKTATLNDRNKILGNIKIVQPVLRKTSDLNKLTDLNK
jgi:hypothetical protein